MSEITQERAVALIEKKLTPIASKAVAFTITTQTEQGEAAEMLTQLSKYSDEITALKETVTKPLNASLKAARELFKPREIKVEAAISALRRAMGAYQLAADNATEEAKAKLAARVEKGTMKAETAVRKMDEVDEPAAKIETQGGGSVKFRDQKKFEVVDLALLPIEYHMADESAIRKAMQQNIELPGVKYSIEKIPVSSR